MGKRINHTSCKKGIRVFVRLRSGKEFIEKFVEKKGKRLKTENHTFTTADIDIFTIAKRDSW